MGKKLPHTPRSKIRAIIRRYIWLRSRERSAALKRTNNCCAECGIKQTRAKGREIILEVHHIDGAHIDEIIDEVFRYLLCHPDRLIPLCDKCHKKKGLEHDQK